MSFAPVLAALLAAGSALAPVDGTPTAHEHTPAHRAEVARIQAHFDSVLAVLPTLSPAGLTPARSARRAALFATLRGYRDAGVFPHNYDFGRTPTPYFIDRRTGTLCAVAYLMASTGRRDIAERVAATNNNVLVAELAGDTAFTGWLEANGLTLDEAAWIQVPYIGEDPSLATATDTRYGAVSIGTSAAATTLSLVNAFTNRDGHGRARGLVGLALGGASLGVAVIGARSDAPAPMVAANAITGALSLALSTRGIMTQRRLAAQERERGSSRVAASVAPIVPVDAHGARAGVAVALRF